MKDERYYNYHIGDLVTIRHGKDIPYGCLFGWNTNMEKWSGNNFIISKIEQMHFFNASEILFEGMSKEMQRWRWSTDMIRPATVVEIHDDEILDLLQPLI